jgi:hypothetical protein
LILLHDPDDPTFLKYFQLLYKKKKEEEEKYIRAYMVLKKSDHPDYPDKPGKQPDFRLRKVGSKPGSKRIKSGSFPLWKSGLDFLRQVTKT